MFIGDFLSYGLVIDAHKTVDWEDPWFVLSRNFIPQPNSLRLKWESNSDLYNIMQDYLESVASYSSALVLENLH